MNILQMLVLFDFSIYFEISIKELFTRLSCSTLLFSIHVIFLVQQFCIRVLCISDALILFVLVARNNQFASKSFYENFASAIFHFPMYF